MAAPITYKIYYKSTLAADWTEADVNLFLDSVKFAVAPGTPTANLSRDYGYIRRDDATGVVAALDLRGQWLKITISDGTTDQDWYGYCPTQADAISGTHANPADPAVQVPSGRTQYQAFGPDFFLRAFEVDRCYVLQPSAVVAECRRVLAFNMNARIRNNQLVGKRTQSKPSGYPCHTHDVIGTDQWTALDAVEHLIYTFNEVAGIQITLAGQYADLANVIEPWGELSGSFYQALTTIINPARGFTFYLSGWNLHVVSVSDVAIGAHVPANPNVTNIYLTDSNRIGSAELTNLENVHYDKIIVRGERLRVCFTMRKDNSNNTLEEGWSAAKQTAYGTATDSDRAKETYDPVYCRFVLPIAWTGMALTAYAVPRINPATGYADFNALQTIYRPDLLLDRSIPIFDQDSTGSDDKQEKRPLVWYKDSSNKYQLATKPGDDTLKACSVKILDDKPGFQLMPKYPHYFGKNRFSGTSDNEAVIDWETLLATVSLYTDEHVRVEVVAQEEEPGEVEKVKIIDVPGCHLWYVIDGTVIDASDAATVNQNGNLATRDDTAVLRLIAELAKVWYGRSRSAISVTFTTPFTLPYLGYVVTDAYVGGSAPTHAGTLITAIEYDLNRLTASFRTEWLDIDLTGMAKRRGETGVRRCSPEEGNFNNSIVDVAAPGGGGAQIVPVKLTAKTNDTTYTGTVYSDGTDAAATETGVTIRVRGLSTGDTLPFAVWMDATKQAWDKIGGGGTESYWTMIGVPRWL